VSEQPDLSILAAQQSFSLAEGLTAKCGEEFLDWLTHHLVRSTGLDFALIGEFRECDTRRVRWHAISKRGVRVPASDYDLRDSPLRELPANRSVSRSDGIGRDFAADEFVRSEGIESGAGILIEDSLGAPLGVLAVFHGRPIEHVDEVVATLRLFAARLGGELELLRAARWVRLLTDSGAAIGSEDGLAVLLAGVSRALGVKVAFVAELADREEFVARTIALTIDGRLQANIEYDMRDTPCEYVTRAAESYHPAGILDHYPDDTFLAEVGAESYYSLAFFGPEGEAIGHLGVIHDAALPEQVRQSPLLRTLALRGRDAVRARAADGRHAALRRRLLELEERHRHEPLVPGIIHDLKNLLAALVGSSALMLESCRDAESRRHAVRTQSICERTRSLLAHLLDCLERERVAVAMVDLNQVVLETIEMLRPAFDGAIELQRELEPSLAPVAGSPAELGQLVMNLVLNAVQACAEKGRVRITTTALRIERDAPGGALPEGSYACLAVEDNGPGIPIEHRSRIFEPRFTTRQDGRGLGLAVVKQVAARHSAVIDVASEPDEGTEFRVYFRLGEPAARPAPAE